jgi:coenzyme PQQ synthesis protein D (PqqD)
VRPNAHVLCRQVKDGAVLIHLETNQIYDLNRTGYRIWQLLQQGSDSASIRDRIHEEFDVDPAVAANELHTLLDRLSSEGLIEEEKDADGPAA